MAQFKAFDPKIEVNGQTILSVIDGMGSFEKKGIEILAKHGIAAPKPNNWYSQQAWLNAFEEIYKDIGEGTLFQIGKSIPENADWPPEIDNIEKALASIDIAYHMNHRRNGKILFDPETKEMSEGIGHYHFEKTGERSAKITCDNPYPAEFDKGIIEAVTRKFKPDDSLLVKVNHSDSPNCRHKGGDTCIYEITW